MNRFRESGTAGLVNLRRGRPGNHRLPESLKLRALSLLHDHYSDFGPTLAAENIGIQHDMPRNVYKRGECPAMLRDITWPTVATSFNPGLCGAVWHADNSR